ncbi:hypothetical protein VTK73DRAFT_1416 [Phialemonium thermophilum]|uniref:Uncharacterized protein n=1 Tax=Phialemonium thermophilum TaxID=223376 RepID=A0ABR3VTH8_9PEZI
MGANMADKKSHYLPSRYVSFLAAASEWRIDRDRRPQAVARVHYILLSNRVVFYLPYLNWCEWATLAGEVGNHHHRLESRLSVWGKVTVERRARPVMRLSILPLRVSGSLL